MACHLFCAKHLPKPVRIYRKLDHEENIKIDFVRPYFSLSTLLLAIHM